jgi:hypothetical protein
VATLRQVIQALEGGKDLEFAAETIRAHGLEISAHETAMARHERGGSADEHDAAQAMHARASEAHAAVARAHARETARMKRIETLVEDLRGCVEP